MCYLILRQVVIGVGANSIGPMLYCPTIMESFDKITGNEAGNEVSFKPWD